MEYGIWLARQIWVLLLLGVMVGVAVSAERVGAAPAVPQVDITLAPMATGLSKPVDLAGTPVSSDTRLFVVQQTGIIRIMRADGTLIRRAFLDIRDRVGSGGERGLLGLVFHPNYAANGFFYVNYTNLDGNSIIARYQVTANPNVADPASEQILLQVAQPFRNHKGGDLAFGPDGYLYIALGDGGSNGDPQGNAQNIDSLLGKILRIDVDHGSPYAIPPDNPFVGQPGADEIWAYGFRNPWRFSFDRQTGDLYIGDVGEDSWEEVDFQAAGAPGGQNDGWRCYEGNHAFNLTGCNPDQSVYTFPIHEYSHSDGCAITGGFVYRGAAYPALVGHYFFADHCSGHIWDLAPDGMGGWALTDHGALMTRPMTFGENSQGELFVADPITRTVYQLRASGANP